MAGQEVLSAPLSLGIAIMNTNLSKYFAPSLVLLASLLLTACEDRSGTAPAGTAHAAEQAQGEIVNATARSADGQVLQMQFNNALDTATLLLGGQTIKLSGQRPASGIWYANSEYELRGKGGDVELKRNGITIFKSAAAD